jgi:energy-coupling factor transporter ATP-binding protein EcfA2
MGRIAAPFLPKGDETMLTRLKIKNFKGLKDVDIELGQNVVFIGPNNSGKTTALQALSLWEIGLRRWSERRKKPSKRPGVLINRKDLTTIPIPEAELLWHKLKVLDDKKSSVSGRQKKIHIQIIVEGVTEGKQWECGMDFRIENSESLYCQPSNNNEIPPEALTTQSSLLPAMSGLVDREDRLERGSIQRRIGEGRTAEVLRNLCFRVYEANSVTGNWNELKQHIKKQFGIQILDPEYFNGEITLSYKELNGFKLDISSVGRGMLQILLLLAYMYDNPGAVLLLDEPDAHLEILRQKEMYGLLTDVAKSQGSQIIIASHSEVLMNEAADRDMVIAFVGKPHRIDDRSHLSQVAKALREIGFDQYYQAEQTGWILYLEGATDLAILRAFASQLGYSEAVQMLSRVFSRYVANDAMAAMRHYQGLREAKPDLEGIVLFDHRDRDLPNGFNIPCEIWKRREIENYLCYPEVLTAYAADGIFDEDEQQKRVQLMQRLIEDYVPPIALRDRTHQWWSNTKASDDFLDPLFEAYFKELGLPNLLRKTDYHVLANFVPKELIDQEVVEKLDAIVAIAKKAKPRID